MSTIEVVHREPEPVLSIRQTVSMQGLTRAQGESLHELWGLLRQRGVQPTGRPFVRYYTLEHGQTDVEVGVPVPSHVDGEGRMASGQLPGGPAVTTVHLGSHDILADAYARISDWLTAHGEPDGPAWEVYEWIDLNHEPDPSTWPAPATWRTQLIQPIQ